MFEAEDNLGAFWHSKKKRKEKKAKRQKSRSEKSAKRKKRRAERREKRGGKTWAGNLINKVNRFNPATIALRNGILAAMKINFMKFAQKIRYAYLTEEQAKAVGISPKKLGKLKKVLTKLIKTFEGLGGKKSNLQKAIINGKGNKRKPISVNGLGIAAESLVAAASTVITALLAFMKKEGVNNVDKEVEQYGEEGTGEEGAGEESAGEEGEDDGVGNLDETDESLLGLDGILLPIAIVAGAGAAYMLYKGGSFSTAAVRIKNNLVIETSIGQLTLKRLIVNVNMKNPTGQKLTISHPFVKIFTSEEKISALEPDLSSTIENQTHTIEPYAETKFQIEIPLSLMGAGMAIINIAKSGKPEKKVWIVTTVQINGIVPYEKRDEVNLPKLSEIKGMFSNLLNPKE